MSQQEVREKRTFDQRVYTLDCTQLLDDDETITSVPAFAADQGDLTFGVATVNTVPVALPNGATAAVGKAIQVRIKDGLIPAPKTFLLCTVRARFATNKDPQVEATVLLRLTDQVYSQ